MKTQSQSFYCRRLTWSVCTAWAILHLSWTSSLVIFGEGAQGDSRRKEAQENKYLVFPLKFQTVAACWTFTNSIACLPMMQAGSQMSLWASVPTASRAVAETSLPCIAKKVNRLPRWFGGFYIKVNSSLKHGGFAVLWAFVMCPSSVLQHTLNCCVNLLQSLVLTELQNWLLAFRVADWQHSFVAVSEMCLHKCS